MRIGDRVVTKAGIGEIVRINTDTYSIPMYHVRITEGKHKGEEIATPTAIKAERGTV